MGDICGGKEELLNVTHFWASDNPRLPQCFSRSVLTILPAIVIIINWAQVRHDVQIQSSLIFTSLYRLFIN